MTPRAERSSMPSRETLLRTISERRRRIETLQVELDLERDQLATLEAELRTSTPATVSTLGAQEKVRLFRSLFRGRDDIYPRRWDNHKTGKSGYAPVCGNEWLRGICEKPRVKCGECTNRAFRPVTDQVILDHLQGRHGLIAGVYPLLQNETCHFLAADFDKTTWTDDVLAFAATCRQMGVPVAVERSRSSNGGHAWIFFQAPVAAALARRMGCYLLTETMRLRRDLSLDSYDRFFPNQDTMPKGGFGNLIALPLQHVPRQSGNSVFVDDELIPHADQWGFLSSVDRMRPEQVEEVAREGARRGRVIGVRAAEPEDDDTPWALPVQRRAPRLECGLPSSIHAVLAQRLFIEKDGLAPPAINAIKRLAAFQNPEFYKKQNMRMSTALTPRVITCADDLTNHISLPRGCVADLEAFAVQNGARLSIDDQRQSTPGLGLRFRGTLTAAQEEATQTLLAHDTGMFVAPPGVGKTVVGAWMTAARDRNTLVLVHRQPLAEQWVAQLCMFLGVSTSDIGVYGGTRRKLNGRLDVAMLQSLSRAADLASLVAGYGLVIVDECHHVPAVSFEKVLSNVRPQCVLGLTATPRRRDGLNPIGEMQLGAVRHTIHHNSPHARRPFELELVKRPTQFRVDGDNLPIQEVYRRIWTDAPRNDRIVADVQNALREGRWPLVVTDRKEHLSVLAGRLEDSQVPIVVLHGGMGVKQRREIAARLADMPATQQRLILAIGRYVGEGFDDPRLDALFLAMPVSWRGTVEQYAGRLHRLHPDKKDVRIYDYVDVEVPVLARMGEKRARVYASLGYKVDSGQLTFTTD